MKKYIIANWKMNGNSLSIEHYFKELKKYFYHTPDIIQQKEIICCLPFPYLEKASSLTADTLIKIGAQDCSFQLEGAYTGDVSAKMLTDIGTQAVLIGHSERRQYHQESKDFLRKKVEQALQQNLLIIFCIGENAVQKAANQALEVLFDQCRDIFPDTIPEGKISIAYEPVWAIGTGHTPSLIEIEKIHQALQTFLTSLLRVKIPLLYGGSVTAQFARILVHSAYIDGVLVGKSSLDSQEFYQIVSAF